MNTQEHAEIGSDSPSQEDQYRPPDELRETLIDFAIQYLHERPPQIADFALQFFRHRQLQLQGSTGRASVPTSTDTTTQDQDHIHGHGHGMAADSNATISASLMNAATSESGLPANRLTPEVMKWFLQFTIVYMVETPSNLIEFGILYCEKKLEAERIAKVEAEIQAKMSTTTTNTTTDPCI